MQSTPYWIAFGDIHDDVSPIADIPGLPGAAGVIITGDITVVGGVRQAERVLTAIAARNPAIHAQIGNMDKAEVTDWLDGRGWNIHRAARELAPGVGLLGAGYSTPTPFGTPSEVPEARLAEWLDALRAEAGRWPRLVFAIHTPPKDSLCDKLGNGAHVGSPAVRAFIEAVQPDVCLCGHIHESRAVDRIGRTVVVNPGALGAGGYAVVTAPEDGPLTAELKVLRG